MDYVKDFQSHNNKGFLICENEFLVSDTIDKIMAVNYADLPWLKEWLLFLINIYHLIDFINRKRFTWARDYRRCLALTTKDTSTPIEQFIEILYTFDNQVLSNFVWYQEEALSRSVNGTKYLKGNEVLLYFLSTEKSRQEMSQIGLIDEDIQQIGLCIDRIYKDIEGDLRLTNLLIINLTRVLEEWSQEPNILYHDPWASGRMELYFQPKTKLNDTDTKREGWDLRQAINLMGDGPECR